MTTIQSVNRRIGHFILIHILARRLAKMLGGLSDVQNIVDHLKHQKFNPKWLLKSNELLGAFKNMKIIRYQAYEDSDQAYSSIIVQKTE